jgi:hypothetical protein
MTYPPLTILFAACDSEETREQARIYIKDNKWCFEDVALRVPDGQVLVVAKRDVEVRV